MTNDRAATLADALAEAQHGEIIRRIRVSHMEIHFTHASDFMLALPRMGMFPKYKLHEVNLCAETQF